ncbi:MAG: hypothetical protein EPN89_04115, partial [Methylovulum sp.]
MITSFLRLNGDSTAMPDAIDSIDLLSTICSKLSVASLIAPLAALLLGLVLGFLLAKHRRNGSALQVKSVLPPEAVNKEPIWHSLSEEQAISAQASDPTQGLSAVVAAGRLKHYGSNRFVEKPPRPVWLLLLSQFKSLLILVLVIAAILATAIGDIKDGIVILVVVIINALLGFYQEFQAEKSLAALKKMLALQAEVRRDGRSMILPAEQLVPGDIV